MRAKVGQAEPCTMLNSRSRDYYCNQCDLDHEITLRFPLEATTLPVPVGTYA
jgi:hypothetical protein